LSRSQLALLKAHGIRPRKRRGQNFLIDGNLARAIAAEVLALGTEVLELGAGGGALTAPLLENGARVVAVEVDRDLCHLLHSEFGDHAQLILRQEDMARLDWPEALSQAGVRPVVAGNLPYLLTSKVLFALAENQTRITGAVLMIQREVADRLVAQPGCRDYGILAVVLGSYFAVRMARAVPAKVFWPQPDVSSAVVTLTPHEIWNRDERERFQAVVKKCFEQRRKKMATILRERFGLDADGVAAAAAAAGCDPDARPEAVDRASWRRLAGFLSVGGST
jgi:16S rRNA (adenine1518-N6/adenine1519-N6)-dimethyltransferase